MDDNFLGELSDFWGSAVTLYTDVKYKLYLQWLHLYPTFLKEELSKTKYPFFHDLDARN